MTINDAYADILCIDDLERAASSKMDRMTRGYFNSGSGDLVTYVYEQALFLVYFLLYRTFYFFFLFSCRIIFFQTIAYIYNFALKI